MINAAALSCSLVWCLAVAPALAAGATLFPTPLHLTRQVHDSISGKTAVLEEYGYGNRLVSIRGSRTSIADYEKGELVEIDRDAGTYSVTRFDALARANQIVNPPTGPVAASSAPQSDRAVRSLGVKATKGGRSAEYFEAELGPAWAKEKVTVAVDRTAMLSKEALEVLVGAAFPGVRTGEHDVVLSVAAPAARTGRIAPTSAPGSDAAYALPVEQITSLESDGQQGEFRSTVMRVGAEVPPADLVAIPAGARLVTSRIVEVANALQQIDHPTTPQAKDH
jgi:hypothetical protein